MRRQLVAAAAVLAVAAGLFLATPAGAQFVAQYVASKFTSTAPSGAVALEVRNAGALVRVGPGAGAYLYEFNAGPRAPSRFTAGYLSLTGTSAGVNGIFTVGGALGTCAAALEGNVLRLTGTGGTNTLARTRLCVCTSDGAASPTYAWQNVVSGTVGTTTACNP